MWTMDDIRKAFAIREELDARAERIIKAYFHAAQPGGYASGARVDSINETDNTFGLKYDWTHCGTEDDWKDFPLHYLFLDDAELAAQMTVYAADEAKREAAERERARVMYEKSQEAQERRQLAALKAKYEA